MANNGTKNSNDSQFIITLGMSILHCYTDTIDEKAPASHSDRADELHGKHTLFGRCMGDTVYSAYELTFVPVSWCTDSVCRCHKNWGHG